MRILRLLHSVEFTELIERISTSVDTLVIQGYETVEESIEISNLFNLTSICVIKESMKAVSALTITNCPVLKSLDFEEGTLSKASSLVLSCTLHS